MVYTEAENELFFFSPATFFDCSFLGGQVPWGFDGFQAGGLSSDLGRDLD
jgi:hypothetical protein